MPMAAICANISWEFIFAFFYPQNDLQRYITLIWFVLDVFILMQFYAMLQMNIERCYQKAIVFLLFDLVNFQHADHFRHSL